MRLRVLQCYVMACMIVLGADARAAAQVAAVSAAIEPAPPEPAAEAAEPAAEFEPVQAITAAQTNAARKVELSQKLAALQSERDDTHRLGPWLLTSAGIATLVVGLSVGIANTIGCQGSCRGPFWPGWLVVVGAGAGTAGMIWLARKNEDIAELELRKANLEFELRNVEWNSAANMVAAPRARAALTWRTQF